MLGIYRMAAQLVASRVVLTSTKLVSLYPTNWSLLLSFWTLSIVRISTNRKRTMDKVQKLNSNECYTPSSEPFRMYFLQIGIYMYTTYRPGKSVKSAVLHWCNALSEDGISNPIYLTAFIRSMQRASVAICS
jgi:hypothetical protein